MNLKSRKKLIEDFVRRQVRKQLKEFRDAPVSTIAMSHLSDLAMTTSGENRNKIEFVKWLIFHYDNMKERIDPNEEYQKFINRNK